MRTKEIVFHDPVALAKFLTVIVREGLTYDVRSLCGGDWAVTLTGGF